MVETVVVNAKGLPCPMPLIKLKKALTDSEGNPIEIHATDKGVLKDIPAFCHMKSLSCELIKDELEIIFLITPEGV